MIEEFETELEQFLTKWGLHKAQIEKPGEGAYLNDTVIFTYRIEVSPFAEMLNEGE